MLSPLLLLPAVSEADCYVQLWLPTASFSPTQTRTVVNCSDPEWNETFHYQIHGAVKVWSSKGLGMEAMTSSTMLILQSCPQNVLELALYDKDVLDSDKIFSLLFDLSTLQLGQPCTKTFTRQQVRSAWTNSK